MTVGGKLPTSSFILMDIQFREQVFVHMHFETQVLKGRKISQANWRKLHWPSSSWYAIPKRRKKKTVEATDPFQIQSLYFSFPEAVHPSPTLTALQTWQNTRQLWILSHKMDKIYNGFYKPIRNEFTMKKLHLMIVDVTAVHCRSTAKPCRTFRFWPNLTIAALHMLK